ncbi:MAG TPA: hypothetical protein VFB75_18610 [Burkholderiales bacterium]|nr:hypothetical protein [Burkholderiales bacterium]
MAYEAGMRQGTELEGKVALVTGGARTIGRAIHINGAGYLP